MRIIKKVTFISVVSVAIFIVVMSINSFWNWVFREVSRWERHEIFEQPKPMMMEMVEPNEPNAVWDANAVGYGDYYLQSTEPKAYRCPAHGDLTTWETMTISTGDDKEFGPFCGKCIYEHLAKYLIENLPGIEKIEPDEVKQ